MARAVGIDLGGFRLEESLQHWVNDALMVIFFFVVGLEIKYELVTGGLRDPRTAALPIVAAIGGMIVPAGLYLLVAGGGAGSAGWGIPMATDIAFAVGVLGLLGRRIPSAARLFLLTLAIVDDIGAIIVIAAFYTDKVEFPFLVTAAVVALAVAAMHRFHITYAPVIILAGFVLWLAVYESGIHATIAGVVMGLLMPARPLQSDLDPEELADALQDRPDVSANDVMAQLLYLESEDPDRDINIYINSPGGSFTALTAIYDTMQFVRPDISTVCLGQAASAAAVLLAAGAPGKRFAVTNARILIHQPSGSGEGQSSDIEIQAREIMRMRDLLEHMLARHSGQDVEKVRRDLDRDKILTAAEAVEYGLIDEVVSTRKAAAHVSAGR